MNITDRVCGVLVGVVALAIGITVATMDTPFIGRHKYGFSTFRWVGWLFIPFGCAMFTTNIYGFFTDRKKHLADIARCKARREQEAEVAKPEDNQH